MNEPDTRTFKERISDWTVDHTIKSALISAVVTLAVTALIAWLRDVPFAVSGPTVTMLSALTGYVSNSMLELKKTRLEIRSEVQELKLIKDTNNDLVAETLALKSTLKDFIRQGQYQHHKLLFSKERVYLEDDREFWISHPVKDPEQNCFSAFDEIHDTVFIDEFYFQDLLTSKEYMEFLVARSRACISEAENKKRRFIFCDHDKVAPVNGKANPALRIYLTICESLGLHTWIFCRQTFLTIIDDLKDEYTLNEKGKLFFTALVSQPSISGSDGQYKCYFKIKNAVEIDDTSINSDMAAQMISILNVISDNDAKNKITADGCDTASGKVSTTIQWADSVRRVVRNVAQQFEEGK